MNTNHILATMILSLGIAPAASAQGILLPSGDPDPNYANLWAWYDASSGLNSSTTPLPDLTPVTHWDDQSFNLRHLTRIDSNPARNPLAHDNFESCGPAVYFDGDDYIWGAASGIGRLSNPRTIFIVVRTEVVDRRYIFDSSTSSGRTALFCGQTSNPDVWNVYWGDSGTGTSNLLIGPPVETHRYLIHTVLIDVNNQEHLINGAQVSSDTQPAISNLGGLVLGARYTTTHGLEGHIREVLIYEEALNSNDRQLIELYLLGRHPLGYGAPYGTACAGSGGFVPVLGVGGCPAIGGTFELRLSEALGGGVATYIFGLNRTQIPLGPCEWLVGNHLFMLPVGATVGTGAGAGTQAVPLSIPGYVGPGSITVQSAVQDPGAAPFGFTFTNGLEVFWL